MADMSDMQKLKMLFDYAINQKNGSYQKQRIGYENTEDTSNIHFNDAPLFVQYAIDLFGYNGFPQIADSTTYNNLKCKTLYRGVKDKSFAQNLINDYNYHYGYGTTLNGLYFSQERRISSTYGDFVFKVKLADDTKIATLSYFPYELLNLDTTGNPELDTKKIETFKVFFNSINTDKQKSLFHRLFIDYPEILYIYLGFDAFKRRNGDFVVFNRAKIVLSQSEAKKILGNNANTLMAETPTTLEK